MPMHSSTGDAPLEDSVRKLSELRWSTRAIARKLGVSQSTVVREQQKINTGPNPIIRVTAAGGESPGEPAASRRLRLGDLRRRRPHLHPGTLLTVALLMLGTVILTVLWARLLHATASPAQVTACVQYDPAGYVTGITAGGGCPPGWKTVVLTPVP